MPARDAARRRSRLRDLRRNRFPEYTPPCDLGRFAHAVQGIILVIISRASGFHGGRHFGFTNPGDGHAANAVARQFLGPGDSHCGNAGFSCWIIALADVTCAWNTRNVDDAALTLGVDHGARCFTTTQEYAGQVDIDNRLPFSHRHLLDDGAFFDFQQQAITKNTGIVDQSVQLTKVGHDFLGKSQPPHLFGHVAKCMCWPLVPACSQRALVSPVALRPGQSGQTDPFACWYVAMARPRPCPPPVIATTASVRFILFALSLWCQKKGIIVEQGFVHRIVEGQDLNFLQGAGAGIVSRTQLPGGCCERTVVVCLSLVALTELWILLQVGSLIGGWATVGLVMLTGFIGITLLRRQGFQLLMQVQQRMQQGEMPAQEMLEGVCLLFGDSAAHAWFSDRHPGLPTIIAAFTARSDGAFWWKDTVEMVVQPMGSMNGRPVLLRPFSHPERPWGRVFQEETVVIRLDEQKSKNFRLPLLKSNSSSLTAGCCMSGTEGFTTKPFHRFQASAR